MTMTKEEFDESEPAPEQGIEPEKSSEEKEQEMDTGDDDEDVYNKEGRKKLKEDDEIDTWEEAFMEGAEGGGHKKGHVRGKPDEELEEEK